MSELMKSKSEKVLITGANGFIGSHVTHKLLNEGYDVGIIKREKSDLWRIKDILDQLTIYNADISNIKNVMEVIIDFKPNSILHLATYYAVQHQPQEIQFITNTNVTGTLNLLEASKENSVNLFVNTSSCFVYEESNDKISEDNNLRPLNLYALSKINSEEACTFYSDNYGLKTVTFRIFPPYGPADHQRRLIPFVINNILNDEKLEMTSGKQKWDFIYVEDIADAYIKVIQNSEQIKDHDIFNLGTGKASSVREVVTILNNLTDNKVKPVWGAIPQRKNEIWNMYADIQKAEDIIKWQPQISLKEGLTLTLNWYQKLQE